MVAALRLWIGKICHVYLDDIIIWSADLVEHIRNVEIILKALRGASLYCSLKKTSLFCSSIEFLGHRISAEGIQADASKAAKISSWPTPKTASDVRQFLGLVRYLSRSCLGWLSSLQSSRPSRIKSLAENTSFGVILTRRPSTVSSSWSLPGSVSQ